MVRGLTLVIGSCDVLSLFYLKGLRGTMESQKAALHKSHFCLLSLFLIQTVPYSDSSLFRQFLIQTVPYSDSSLLRQFLIKAIPYSDNSSLVWNPTIHWRHQISPTMNFTLIVTSFIWSRRNVGININIGLSYNNCLFKHVLRNILTSCSR